jgi:hypothetical protein
MADEVHEVVTLLLARMESNPEEFRPTDASFHDRWYDHVNAIQAFGNEADKAAISEGLRKIRLAETHERVMDELLNGEDRRRKHAEDTEYERHLAASVRHMKQQQIQQNTQKAIYDIDTDTYRVTATAARYPTSTDMENNGIVSALRKLVS